MNRLISILCILFLALAVRLLFLSYGGVTIDSDEAIVGLMARHLVEGRDWPIFYYGQHYMGSLEPTLVALIFRFFGESEWTLKIVPLIFSLIFVYQVFLLGERLDGTRSGYIASILAAAPPVGFVEWSTKARGGFIELVVLGTGALLIAVSIYQQKRPKLGSLCLLAFVLGIAWWVNNQAIFYIVTIGLFLFVPLFSKLGLKFFLRDCLIASCFFFLGGAPFWYYNLVFYPRFETFKQLGGHAEFPNEVIEHFSGFFTEALPILLGSRRFWSKNDLFQYSSLFGFIVAAITLIAFLAYLFQQKSLDKKGSLIVLLFMAVTPLIFAFSSFGWLTSAPRYLLPLYSVWFVCVAISSNLKLFSLKLGSLLLVAIFGLSLCSNYLGGISIPGQPYVVNGERVSKDHTELNQWLVSHNFSHIFTNYWIGYRVAFETGERVTFSIYSEPYTFRIPRYENIGEEYLEVAPFVLVPTQVDEVSEALDELFIPYELFTASNYVILVPTISTSIISPRGEETSSEIPFKVTNSSSRKEWLSKISDHNRASRWGSGVHQSPGMFLEGRFNSRNRVSIIEIDGGFWLSDSARHLSLQLVDGDNSCLVYEGSTLPLHNFYGPKVQFRLPWSNTSAEYGQGTGLRLEQQGKHPVLDWSVAEINVFSKN